MSDKTWLFLNNSKEDQAAYRMLLECEMKFSLVTPVSDEKTPLLIYNSRRIYGLESIKNFIKNRDVETKQKGELQRIK